MRKMTVILAVIIAIAFVGSAMAVGTKKTVEYTGGTQGKVIFDGTTHQKAGKCPDCHPKTFGPMSPHKEKMKAPMKGGEHVAGEFCGICHDGKKAFDQDAANCAKCHKKDAAPTSPKKDAGGY
ncbi:MAG: cytochrome c3 family protein [Thermodesulfovibrionales bacterium]|nr:cytochrome c3 family protein [Thermodesulfovibrionales bacterium]